MTSPVALRRSHFPTLVAALGLLLLLAPTPHARGQAGPIAHWKFDEVAGPTAFDSASTNHGTLSAAGATFVPGGISGNAMSLDKAANGLVNMGNILSLTNGDHSIVAWVKTAPGDVTVPLVVVGKHVSGTRNGYYMMLNGSGGGLVALGKAAFYQGGSGIAALTVAETPISTTSVNDGNWHQIVMVLQVGGAKRIYVDGAPAEDSKPTQAFNPNAAAFLIGGTQSGLVPTANFNGLIDDVQIYDRALADTEIDFLFRNPGSETTAAPPGTSGKCLAAPPGLVSMWPFEGNLMDAIGTNHGNLVGSLGFVSGKVSQAVDFAGSAGLTNYFVAQASPSLDVGVGPGLTIEGWINPTDLQTFQPLVEWNRNAQGSPDTIGAHLWINVRNGGFVPGGGPGALYVNLIDLNSTYHVLHSTPGVLTSNRFNHVATTFDRVSGITKLFVNGALVGQTNVGNIIPHTSYDLYFGKRVANNVASPPLSFTGAMDEMSLYNRALSDAEIQAIAQAGANGKYRDCSTNSVILLSKCSAAPPGLVALWPFEGNVRDSVGTNHGTVVGSLSFAPGEVFDAVDFTGSSGLTNYFVVPAAPSHDVGVGPGLTIEGWINPNDLQTFQPLLEWNRNAQGEIDTLGAHFWINVRDGGFVPGGGPGALYVNLIDLNSGYHVLHSTPGVLTSNRFNHVATTFDQASGITKLFVNGTIVGQTNVGSITPRTSYDLYFGKRIANNYANPPLSFTGLMDEMSLYNRALSDAEIQTIALAGTRGKYGNCSTNAIGGTPVEPSVSAGTTITLTAEVGGTPPVGYQWTRNSVNVPGATSGYLTIPNASLADAGDYAVRVYYASGALLSSSVNLTVYYPLPVITSLSSSPTVALNGAATFAVTAVGPGPLSYLWRKAGVNILGATNANYGLTDIQAADSGDYQVVVSNPGGAVVSSNIVLSIAGAPVITTQPASRVIALGSPVSFDVTASGAGPLLYQWRFNRADLPGETNPTLAFASAQVPDAGLYSVVVANLAGVARSVGAELRFIGGPVIVAQPRGQVAPVGGSVTFDVGVLGDAPLTYQWRFNGAALAGKTNQSLTLTQLSLAAAGNYSVVVTNSLGLAISTNAALTVYVPLAIISQPVSQVIAIGGTARFNVGVVGAPPFSYQWLSNGVPITNAIAADLQLDNAQAAQAGAYSVVVTDSYNTVTSSEAGLQLFSPLPSYVLFNGTDTLKWTSVNGGGPVPWPIVPTSALQVVPGTGSIQTTQTFTDFQLHVEFRTPTPRVPGPTSGNSGVYIQGRYEVQIFDSFGVATPGTNDCGAIWGLIPPTTNACLAPGEWQSYDITFHASQWNGATKVRDARITVMLNNILVQNDVAIPGTTIGGVPEAPTAGPILLQDNGASVQFRNIVVTPLDAAPRFVWVRQAGGANPSQSFEIGKGVKVDAKGRVFVVGDYLDGATFSGGTNSTNLASAGGLDVFLAQYDTDGNFYWAVGGGGSSTEDLSSLAIDSAGNLIAAGVNASLNSRFGTQTLPAFGGPDAMVVKFRPDGSTAWAHSLGGANRDLGLGVRTDRQNNVVFVGFQDTLGFLVKYDPAGNVIWRRDFTSSISAGWEDLVIAVNGDIFVTGVFAGTATFGSTNVTAIGGTDMVLAKYNSAGQFQWVITAGGTGNSQGTQMTMDRAGNLLITGIISGGNASFGTNVISSATIGTWTAKYDPNGQLLWIRLIDRAGTSKIRGAIAVDGQGNTFVSANPFGPVDTGTVTLNGFGGTDALVAKYAPDGGMVWAVRAGGAGDEVLRGLDLDAAGNVYLVGTFQGTAIFGTNSITAQGPYDIFIARLGDDTVPAGLVASQRPFISIQPPSQDVPEDFTLTFSPTVGGADPLVFQWRFNGVDLPGSTNATLTLNAVTPTNAGIYTLFITNQYGSVLSSNAVLTVLGVPVVTLQPQDQQLYVGEDLNLRVAAAGTPPLSYLWRFNNVNIPGGTNATLRVPNVTTNDAGEYFAIVANAAGVALSQKAFVSVNPAPFVLLPPQTQSVALGTTATFAVQLLGQSPFAYQWLWNGFVLSGETGATLNLATVQPINEGRYSVAVTNAFGGVVSAEAQLTVIRPAFTVGRATDGSGGLALSFPPEATGFILESSPTLGVNAVWTTVTNLTTLPNGQLILPIDPAAGLRFYRLRTPVSRTPPTVVYPAVQMIRIEIGGDRGGNQPPFPPLPPTDLAPGPSSP